MIDETVKNKQPVILSSKQNCALTPQEYLSDIPVVAFSGFPESGKTTLIEKIIPEIKRRGYRVATIKRTHHEPVLESSKDSQRHIEAGSEATLLATPNQMVLVKPVADDVSLDEMILVLGDDYDLIICEGFKYSAVPKVLVHRKGAALIPEGNNVIGVVTDEALDINVRQFSHDDIEAIADMIERDIVKPHAGRVNIFVNNSPVPLIEFPRSIITKTVLGMLASLKGVRFVRSARISVNQPMQKGK
jgi:molybdopterin-guanine dinucleotide biosynthesis adapter protein